MSQIVTSVDPEGLRHRAAPFTTVGDGAKRVMENLRTGIEDIGNCWGSDETGRSFIETYGPQRDQLTEGGYGVEAMLYQIADGLRAMATGYQNAEDSAHHIAR